MAIEGPAGIGKTRLLAHARQQAASAGWRVFDTRCTPLSTSIAYGLPRDWFGTLAHRGAGSHPFDGPGQVLADLVDGRTPGIGDLVYGVRWVLEDLSTARPVLLIADDLQWADEASLQTLDLLVNALRHLPCLIVYGVRTGERVSAPEALGRVLAASRVLTPLPLSKEAVAEQVRAVRPRSSEAEIDDVHRTSGGVPFYVTELLSSDSRTPEAVVGSVAGRLSRLPGTAGDTARAVCVLGPEASVGTVAELTHLSLDVVADDISALVGAQILSLDHGSLTARHPLVADVILAGSSTHEVADLHARAARILAGRGASRAVIAAHLLQTLPGENPDTRARLREQGEAAMRTGALDVAVRYFERALAEGAVGPSEVGLLSSLARALAGLREIDAALGHWDRAIELTETDDARARLRAESGDALVTAGRHGDAQAAFGTMLDHQDPVAGRQRLMTRMVLAGLMNGISLDYLRAQLADSLTVGDGLDDQDDRLGLAAAAVLLSFECRDGARARELAIRSVGTGELLEEEPSEGSALYFASGVLTWVSAYAEAEALLTSAIEDAQARTSAMAFGNASACRGTLRMRMGMVTEAIQDLEAALAQRAQGWNAYLAPVLAALVEGRIARGELDLAASHREELEELAHVPGVTGAFATYALADLAAAHADNERAAQLYADVGTLVVDRMDNPAILAWRSGESLARIRLGQHREAILLARENAVRARAFAAPYALAQALRTLAAVDPTADRIAVLREALTLLRGIQAPRLEAQIATDLAGMLLLSHGMTDTGEVVGLLRRAESYAAFQELRPLGERVHRLLERIGEPVKRSTVDALNTLTVSERRVADLAASGMSNRQIEWHLSNVYRKLGIRSRTRLPALLTVPAPRTEVDATRATFEGGRAPRAGLGA